MSWAGRVWAACTGQDYSPGDDFWYGPVGSGTGKITHQSAMQAAIVSACVRVLSGSIASLPLKLYRRQSNGDKQAVPQHPLYTILHDQANEEHTAQEFREMMTAYAVSRGTSFAQIKNGARGPVTALLPIHPDEIRPVTAVDLSGRKQTQFEVRREGEPMQRLLRHEVFIYRALIMDRRGILGVDPITAHANAIGARIASQEYGARFWNNDAQAGLILTHPTKFSGVDDKKRFIQGWQESSTGTNRHKTRVLEFGITPTTIGMSNEQSQFLETQKYQDVDIARIFNVQPHKVGILDRATFSNIEEQNLDWVTDTLMPWAVRWHQSIYRDLLRDRTLFAEHSFDALLRGQTLARFQAYAIGRNWGWLSANDVLRKENQNSIGPDGDHYLRPLNMALAGDPAEPSSQGRPTSAEAFSTFQHPTVAASDNGKRNEH